MLKSAKFATDTRLKVFGQTVETDIVAAEKVGVKGTTNYVSARDLAHHLGYQVKYDSKNKIISVGLYPQNGVEIPEDVISKAKRQVKPQLDEFMSKFSARQLDSLNKEMAYYLQLVDGDPSVFSLLLVEDYKTYRDGGESNFDYFWKAIDAE